MQRNNAINESRRQLSAERVRRRGATLLVVLFIMLISSMTLIGILDSTASQSVALNNSIDYDKALFLANAAVHHAAAELELNGPWYGTIGPIEFPAGSGETYTATTTVGSGDTVIITGAGTSGSITRSLQATVSFD